MAASQSGVFSLQEFSDIGAPLVGGRLYTYVYGTTTHKTAYTDKAGAIPHTYTSDGIGGQYIALNARGELPAPLYLAAGSYDIALKDAGGATIWTRRADPVDDSAAALALDLASTSDASKGTAISGHKGLGSDSVNLRDRLNKVVFSGEHASLQAAVDVARDNNLPLYVEGANTVTEKVDMSGLRLVEFLPNASITESSSSTITSGDAIIYVNNATGFTLRGHGRKITGYRRGSGLSDIIHGIGLYGCTDTRISDLDIYDCAGDGWYIAPEKTSNNPIACTRTWLTNVRSHNCMRNGAAVVSAKDLWATNCVFSGTNGKSPEAGIDLEPEGGSTLMQNVNLIECIGTDNKQFDFCLTLGGNSTPVTNSVGVSLVSCVSRDSTTYTSTIALAIQNHKNSMANDGYVRVVDFKARNINNHGLLLKNLDKDGQNISIDGIELVDTALTTAVNMISGHDSPFVAYTTSILSEYNDPGGVRISRLRIVDNTRDRAPYHITSGVQPWADVVIDGIDWINRAGETTFPYADAGTDLLARWTQEPFIVNRTADITLSTRYAGWELGNLGASGTVVFTLPAISACFDHTVFDFYVKAAQVLRIDPNAADKIHVFGNGDGKYVQASTIGVRITIKYHDADGWMMTTNKESAITAEP